MSSGMIHEHHNDHIIDDPNNNNNNNNSDNKTNTNKGALFVYTSPVATTRSKVPALSFGAEETTNLLRSTNSSNDTTSATGAVDDSTQAMLDNDLIQSDGIVISSSNSKSKKPQISTQQYLALIVSFLGWACDTMDGALFVMVQEDALKDLMDTDPNNSSDTSIQNISKASAVIFAMHLLGGAVGGITVGILCDYFGRSKMMMVTVLTYSISTALCALVTSWHQLALLRFVTAIGTGGEWACGASLVSEVWPQEYRSTVGPILQSGGSIGSIVGALVFIWLIRYGWRPVFLFGILPAFLLIFMRFFVDESHMWQCSEKRGIKTLAKIFSRKHRKDTIAVSVLVTAKLFVFYSVMVWIPSIMRDEVAHYPQANWADSNADDIAGYAFTLVHTGAIFGNLSWIYTADRFGRKKTLFYMMISIMLVVPPVFYHVHNINTLLALMPIIGFLLAGFSGGLAIWLPELFPTQIRGTGTAFIYNAGRFVGTLGPVTTASLVTVTGSYYRAVSLTPIALVVGIVALHFARETKGEVLV